MNEQLTIQVVGWNSEQTLPATMRALQVAAREGVVVRYIDNASEDRSVMLVREILPEAEVIELTENKGFAGAHNEGFHRCTTPYVLTCDPDLVIEWEGVKQLVAAMTADERLGAVQGKLLRADGSGIDSAGIVLTRTLNGIERGAGEVDSGQFAAAADLDAVTGAFGLYRMEALREVGFFDEDFFAYREDVDAGWRLTKAGWKVRYEPILAGYHHRTMGKRGLFGWGVSPKAVAARMKNVRTRYSFRNYVWMVVKNISGRQLVANGFFVAGRLLIFAGLSMLYPPFWRVWGQTLKGVPKMWLKRKSL